MSTETRDPRFADIDTWPTDRAVSAMIDGQAAAIAAIRDQAAIIARAAEAAADRIGRGGRLVYAGAGTSGRLAVQDGVELGPTYGWPEARLVFLLAGGDVAMTEAVEGAEDDGPAATRAIAAADVGATDVVIGVAASGRTPYTLAAIEAGNAAGALTIGIVNNAGTPIAAAAGFGIVAVTGAEPVAGSTRMQAGTAQKAILNILSTATMIRAGYVHRGLMTNMRVSNIKLAARARGMVETLAGVDAARAGAALAEAGNDIGAAVLIAGGASPRAAAAAMARHQGSLKRALADPVGDDTP